RVGSTGSDLIDPKGEATRIRFTIKEIVIMLDHEKLRIVDPVGWQSAKREASQSLTQSIVGPCKNRAITQKAVLKPVGESIDARSATIAASAIKSARSVFDHIDVAGPVNHQTMQKKIVVEGKAFYANFVAIREAIAVVVIEHEHHRVATFRMRKHNATRVNGDVKRRVV